ncbi:hypothetical protein AB7074_24895 [Klebsiella pneumoniae]|uniref:hypothetical protein n=1 Tax=Klebsiella pneumoniae TaxID=573 RepID=UPI001D0CE7A7|nr:hypothetical protein [Klebsiella pneumoniae]
MTKSTITREQLLEIIETDHVQCGEASYLARMALAAMDGEPVALQPELAKVIYHFRDWNEGFPVERFKADYVISWMLANYPPAQPAPVVPDDVSIFEAAIEECKTCDSIDEHAWNHGVLAVIAKYESCRAAMLSGGKP